MYPFLLEAIPAAAAGTFPTANERQALVLAGVGGLGYFAKYCLDRFEEWRKGKKEKKQKIQDLQYLSAKTIQLNRQAQHMLDTVACDHVSIYAAANGEYLKSGDSIIKFIMQAEAMPKGEPDYMDSEPIIYANAIPQLITKLYLLDYVLLWDGQGEDEKVNKNMRLRGYKSSICMLITVSTPTGRVPLGMVALSWKNLVFHPIKSQLPEHHGPFETFITLKMQQAIHRFKLETADLLDNKRD